MTRARDLANLADGDFGAITLSGDITMGTNQIVFDNNSQAIQIKDAAGTASYVLYQDNADTLIIGNGTNVETIRLDTSGNEGSLVVDTNGNVSIANGDLTITSTDAASTTPSPVLTLARDGASSEDNDLMGQIVFKMDDDAGNLSTFAKIDVVATDVSNGSEDARIDFTAAKDDSFSAALSIAGQSVGIGDNNPPSSVKLAVQADGIGIRLDGTANTTRSLFFRNTTTTNPAEMYADGSLRIRTEDASTAITFHTNSSGSNNERMRITSDGHLLIGKTADDNTTTGTAIHDNGFMSISRDANIAMILDRTSTDGSILRFTKAGTEVGSIGIESSGFVLDGEGSHAGLKMFASVIGSRQNGSDVNGVIDLGHASGRFKDLYLAGDIAHTDASDTARLLYDKSQNLLGNSGTNLEAYNVTASNGIYVGGTGSANFLDDYEEGTFDVTLTTTGGSVTLNSVYNTMSYTKVGRLVTVFGLIITSGVSSPTGAYAHFDTLPFTSANLTEGAGRSGGGVFYWDGANAHVKPWEISEGATRLTVYIDASTLTSGDDFYFSCTYQAA